MSLWNDPELISLFERKTPLIDVRAPVEFQEGAIPFSVNLPIMNDEERAAVGTCYKEKGQAAAIELGHSLVSGDVKAQRIAGWKKFLEENPEGQVFCFRGGLRSQITCQWITEAGIKRTPIKGGYKRMRKFFLSWLDDAPLGKLVRIGGLTGSGKTNVLQKTKNFIDLEKHANHRGSAFGPRGWQPSQISFENLIALDLMNLRGKNIILEDESATIGKVVIPSRLFKTMRESSIVILEVAEEERLQNIFEDYVKHSNPEFFLKGLERIQKKLGKTKTEALAQDIKLAFEKPMDLIHHQDWIVTLLREYYDPLYAKDIRYNAEKVVFRGPEKEVLAYLDSF